MNLPIHLRWRVLGAVCLAAGVLLAQPSPAALDQAFAQLKQLQYGQDQAPLSPIVEAVLTAAKDRAAGEALERRLATLLQGDAPDAAKDFACRQLKLIGTAESVPALVALLNQPALASLASYALESIPDPAVDAALRDILPRLSGRLQTGVISTMARRRDSAAVKPLSGLARQPDGEVARAAVVALGRIATPEAVAVLNEVRTTGTETMRTVATAACLEAGDRLRQAGDKTGAVALFEALFKEHPRGSVRLAAFQGLVASAPEQANDRLIRALAGSDGTLRDFAVRLVAELPADWDTMPLVSNLRVIPFMAQLRLLPVLTARGDQRVYPVLRYLMQSPEVALRVAALEAAGTLGGTNDISLLAGAAIASTEAERNAGRQSLRRLAGPAVNAAMVAILPQAKPQARIELVRALADRGALEAVEPLLGYLGADDPALRGAAVEALGALGGPAEIPRLATALTSANDAGEREAIGEALSAMALRLKERAATALLGVLAQSDEIAQAALLRALGNAGGPQALEAVRAAVGSASPAIHDAAVRALAEWPDPAAGPDLLRVVKAEGNPTLRALAFRGFVRLGRDSDAPVAAKVQLLSEALAVAGDPAEKKFVLGALGEVPGIESLRLVAVQLDQAQLADEAGAAAVKIAAQLPEANRVEAAAVLQRVVASARAPTVIQDAQRQIRGLGGAK